MKVLFLGTGACDYGLRLETDCICRPDRDVRRSTAVLLDGHVLIDCGDWILDELAFAGVEPAALTHVFISHTHHDHFRPALLCALAQLAGHPVEVYGSGTAMTLLNSYREATGAGEGLVPHEVQVQQPVEFDGWRFTPMRANHSTESKTETALHYLAEKDGRSLFYGTDGAWLPTDTGKSLYGRHLNGYLFDATCGDYDNDYRIFEHNTIPMIRDMLKVLRPQGAFAPDAKLYLLHLAPSLHKSHAETCEIAARDGLLVAYDGLETEI